VGEKMNGMNVVFVMDLVSLFLIVIVMVNSMIVMEYVEAIQEKMSVVYVMVMVFLVDNVTVMVLH